MCGRFWSSLTWEQYRKLLKLSDAPPDSNFQPNWNTAPTHDVLICAGLDGERRLEIMQWGLIPVWAKEPPKYSTINAKCETIEERATWKSGLNKMRCVIPVSGFYEWRGPKGKKQPFAIARKDGKAMMLAGLWAFNDKIDPAGKKTFTIITCEANKTMGAIHSRMPVMLNEEDLDVWLGDSVWNDDHRALLKPCPDDVLTAWPVEKAVGSVKNNHDGLIVPIDEPVF